MGDLIAGLRVLYWIPYPNGLGADRWIYQGWRSAFENLGHTVQTLTLKQDWCRTVEALRPDLLFCPNFVDLVRHGDILRRARSLGVCVFLIVSSPMRRADLTVLRESDPADFYFGEREPESMRLFEAATGKKYHLIPHAAHRNLHLPSSPDPKYAYDIVYLGAKLPKKRQFFDNVLLPLCERYKVGIFGPRWTRRDQLLRLAQSAGRRVGLTKLADSLNARRITVPPEEEGVLYFSATVALNAHEREPDGSQPHYIVNQRAFKIPACGGFQICDDVPALRKYFSENEVVMASSPHDWLEKIDYYLCHPTERETIRRAGTVRALRDHTYHRRVQTVLDLMASA